MDNKFKNICEFYVLTSKLKTLVRSGWLQWGVTEERLESVAEHIYGTQMLAFALNSELELNLDIEKIVFMLAFHELGEVLVGDLTPADVLKYTKKEKHRLEKEAVEKILNQLAGAESKKIRTIFDEFEGNKSKEAVFAHRVDKLECDLQVKHYTENGNTNLEAEVNPYYKEVREKYINQGAKNLAEVWLYHDMDVYEYEGIFKEFAQYILSHKLFKKS